MAIAKTADAGRSAYNQPLRAGEHPENPMSAPIHFKGTDYDSVEAMPPHIRRAYERSQRDTARHQPSQDDKEDDEDEEGDEEDDDTGGKDIHTWRWDEVAVITKGGVPKYTSSLNGPDGSEMSSGSVLARGRRGSLFPNAFHSIELAGLAHQLCWRT